MAGLKELRNRIASVKATQKITKAMQMVAAAKLRRAQEAAQKGRPYANRMSKVMAALAAKVPADDESAPRLLAGTGSRKSHLLLVATAERGLCGGFNSNIARLADRDARRLLAKGRKVRFLCIGRKGFDLLKRDHFERMLSDSFIDLKHVRRIGFAEAENIGRSIIEMFERGEFDVCTLYYSEFRSVIAQQPASLQLIPARLLPDDDGEDRNVPDAANENESAYEYEPDEAEILADLLPRNIMTQIYRALLENAASEQGARMTAMDNATRNAGEMIDRLTLEYNRSRQAQITRELIEIISGAEAL
jgi:F-type H+-transporting ATPase subunit gamma